MTVNVIGAGLAGCEAAWQLAARGVKVNLYDIKPQGKSPAHKSGLFGELVCSNSLKSNEITNAHGLLKAEMRLLNSLIIACADKCAVPAGSALAVDRNLFEGAVTDAVKSQENIKIICGEVTETDGEGITIVCTGPLTSPPLLRHLQDLCGSGNLYFFDAAAPIIDGETIDYSYAFKGGRYGKSVDAEGDYVNCPLDEELYYRFVRELADAERAQLKDFEDGKVFEGCLPIEVLAKRSSDALRYGPLKPVGLTDSEGKTHFAVLQLRRENALGSCFNMVGFQTNLLFGEQKRVFSMIPALKDAAFLRYGVMHKNSYINAPHALTKSLALKGHQNIYIAGQLCGVEGYVESAASGLAAALNVYRRLCGGEALDFTAETMTGALIEYITAENNNFQPMNANFGIIKPLGVKIRDKKRKNGLYAQRSLNKIKEISGIINQPKA